MDELDELRPGMETSYISHESVRTLANLFGMNYVPQLLDNALYQTGSSLHQIPPREYYAGSLSYLTRDPNRFAYNDLTDSS